MFSLLRSQPVIYWKKNSYKQSLEICDSIAIMQSALRKRQNNNCGGSFDVYIIPPE